MMWTYESELIHHGVKGMKWGVRRYQNPDGSWKNAGNKRRNADGVTKVSKPKTIMSKKRTRHIEEMQKELHRLNDVNKKNAKTLELMKSQREKNNSPEAKLAYDRKAKLMKAEQDYYEKKNINKKQYDKIVNNIESNYKQKSNLTGKPSQKKEVKLTREQIKEARKAGVSKGYEKEYFNQKAAIESAGRRQDAYTKKMHEQGKKAEWEIEDEYLNKRYAHERKYAKRRTK